MIAARTDLKPGNWQITATTIRCDLVDDFVTVMVEKDWTTKCAWYNRYKQKALGEKKQKFDKAIKSKIGKCAGPDCSLAIEYRDSLIQDEFGTA